MSKNTLSGPTLKVRVSPKDYAAAIAVVSPLPAEEINWTNSKTFHKYESFTHQEMAKYRLFIVFFRVPKITKYLVHSMIHLLSMVSTYVGYTQIYLF